MTENIRPWGRYDVLSDASDCKVKRITVEPQQRLSYQYHRKRSEHWVVVSGEALITLDGVSSIIPVNQHIFIPIGAKHRIENTSETEDMVFVEVQCGTYFGEDDIVRLSDDYNRNVSTGEAK